MSTKRTHEKREIYRREAIAYVQGESLKAIVPILIGFELPAALVVGVANAFKSIQVADMYDYGISINISEDRPEDALDTCAYLIKLVNCFSLGRDPFDGFESESRQEVAMGFNILMNGIHDSIVDASRRVSAERLERATAEQPRLTERTSVKPARAGKAAA